MLIGLGESTDKDSSLTANEDVGGVGAGIEGICGMGRFCPVEDADAAKAAVAAATVSLIFWKRIEIWSA